jgi:ribonuclease J
MRFKIHRGTKEIGGSCVEVWTDASRIVIDMGMPLANPDMTPFDSRAADSLSTGELRDKGILPDIPSLYQDDSGTSLLISHAHQDHYGLVKHVNPSCQLWLGEATHRLIEITGTFTGQERALPSRKINHIRHNQPFDVGDMTVTPYLMDHAAFDAYAFLIESDGGSLLYSGDFRTHGRKSRLFDWFCAHAPKNADYLLLEGSSIGRTEDPFPTESELEDEFTDVFKRAKGINLVYVSGQNIDRLVTIYRACKKCSKIFLIDFYTANVLKVLHKANGNIPFPTRESFTDIKVWYPKFLVQRMMDAAHEGKIDLVTGHKLGRDELDDMADKLVMLVRPSAQYDLQRFLHKYDGGCFIYSMWDGYKKDEKTKQFLEFIAEKGMPVRDIHTSGHADIPGLKRMAEAVQPKHIVPIHTFEAKRYAEIFAGTDVVMARDGEEMSV